MLCKLLVTIRSESTLREDSLKVPIDLRFTARDIAKAVQRRDLIIVIDVLRCSSTIATALTNAAKGLIPTRTVKEARRLHKRHPEFILAGERKGVRPRGFDCGNSPLEFSPQKVKGKHIILTTTSGTKAIISSRDAEHVFIGAFLNARAVAEVVSKIAEQEKTGVSLVSAGTNGNFSLEDFVCAGAIARYLPTGKVEYSDAVSAALLAFQRVHKSLYGVIKFGSHARRLKSLGFKDDVKFCCQLNAFQIVPFLKGEKIVQLIEVAIKT